MMVQDYPSAFVLTDIERRELHAVLAGTSSHPYREPEEFIEEVSRKAQGEEFHARVADWASHTDFDQSPVLYIRNLPLEIELPVFGHEDPIKDKYLMKTSFVTEALLALVADATRTRIIGYRSINNADLFHDIYLKESLKYTASQKSMVSFGFHYDMGFKRLRPDWANLACLRSASVNRVSASVARNIDLMESLSDEDLAILAEPIFSTPEEVVSLDGGGAARATKSCPVYYADRPWRFEYFEGRTVSSHPDGQQALERLAAACHRAKRYLVLAPGDLAIISNNHGIHCREVLQVRDEAAHRLRWLIKTYNVNNLEGRRDALVPGTACIADE